MVIIMVKKSEKSEPNEFDKEFFPCAKEWWCVEGFFQTIENDNKWSFKADFYQAIGRDKSIWSVYSNTIFDLKNSKIYRYNSSNDSLKLNTPKSGFQVKYNGSYIKGAFPNYKIYLLNPKNNIKLDFKNYAQSKPYWIAQNITDGWLPWGLGYFRYGFIPDNIIKGVFNINNQNFSIKGNSYFEHVWGDFSFFYLTSSKRLIRRTISSYTKLFGNWIHNQDIKIPKSITFSTDNRPPGYDWIWAFLDNGWTIFFGNMTFWIINGIGTGILILSKDGKNYDEFSNVHFNYNKMKYLRKYDFYYPVELEITAKKGKELIFLKIKDFSKNYEGFTEATEEKGIYGFVICEVPSIIEGYYLNDKKRVDIKGLSKMEFHRLLRTFGHNSLRIDFRLSKNKIGILSSLNSHYFRKKLDLNLQFFPRPYFKIKFARLNKSQFK